jgi:deazaflavin-dependent oxidoreductase (nitroreductase family)
LADETPRAVSWLERWSGAPYAYLTTTGRHSGRHHRIEIWFGVHDGRMYLMSGGRDRSDWVKNIQANPEVTVDLGGEVRRGIARIVAPGTPEDELASDLLVRKYATPRNPLADWKRRSLPVVIRFPDPDAS